MDKSLVRALFVLLLVAIGDSVSAQEPKLPPRPKDLDTALLAKAVTPPAADGHRLEIVDRATDEPIAGADVFVVEASAIEAVQRTLRDLQKALGNDQGALDTTIYHRLLAHWYGTRYQTGADGTVAVAPFDRGTVVAFAGDRFAAETFRKWPDQPPTIRLVAQEYYEVLVVDSSGKPAAEVPIGFGLLLNQGPLDSFFHAGVEGRTDGAGRLRVPRDRLQADQELTVQALVLTPDPIRAKLVCDAAGRQGAIPTLQLPPCGMVRVLLYDERERPIERLRSVELQEAKPEQQPGFQVRSARPSQQDRGSAHFRWVALGLKVRAVVGVEGVDGSLTHEQDGPTRAGELVVCGVRMTAANPILRLRALDPAGKPMVNATLGLARTSTKRFHGREITTDGEGRLQWTIDPEWLAADEAGQVLLIARGNGAKQTLYQGALAIDLADIQPGITDLGEVRFQEEPVVLGGVVVDPDGKPLAAVVVTTMMSHLSESRSTSRSSSGRALYFDHRVPTDAQGRFAIRELNPKEVPMRLTLVDPAWVLAETVDATPGETELTLRAVRPGTAELTLADPTHAGVLRFHLRAATDAAPDSYGERRATGAAWQNLVPGHYRLAVDTTDRHVDVLSDLDVPAGGACADPRLQKLDLTDRVRVIEVTVRGQAVLEGFQVQCIHLRGAGLGGNVHGATTDRTGKVRLVLPMQGNKLLLHHPDYRSVEVEEPTADCTFDLVARANVRLRLPEGVKLPDGVGLLVEPHEHIWWAEEEVRWEGIWSNKEVLVLRPDRDGELQITLRDRGGETLWEGKLTVPAGDAVEATLPLDASTATDIGKLFTEGGR